MSRERRRGGSATPAHAARHRRGARRPPGQGTAPLRACEAPSRRLRRRRRGALPRRSGSIRNCSEAVGDADPVLRAKSSGPRGRRRSTGAWTVARSITGRLGTRAAVKPGGGTNVQMTRIVARPLPFAAAETPASELDVRAAGARAAPGVAVRSPGRACRSRRSAGRTRFQPRRRSRPVDDAGTSTARVPTSSALAAWAPINALRPLVSRAARTATPASTSRIGMKTSRSGATVAKGSGCDGAGGVRFGFAVGEAAEWIAGRACLTAIVPGMGPAAGAEALRAPSASNPAASAGNTRRERHPCTRRTVPLHNRDASCPCRWARASPHDPTSTERATGVSSLGAS